MGTRPSSSAEGSAARLREATPEECLARDRVTHEAWGQGLTVEQYLEREQRLRSHPWAKERMRSWVWAAPGDEAILASCGTFRMDSVFRERAGATHGVASVFTDQVLRGQGHASRMMAALVARLREESGAQAVHLFSDVGEALYARSGFVARPAWSRSFTPLRFEPTRDVQLLRDEEVAEALAGLPAPPGPFRLVPRARQLDWHLERERAYARSMGRHRPHACGARTARGLLLWAAGFKTGELLVLLAHAETAREAAALLTAARGIAGAAGLERVVLWEDALPFPWPSPEDGERVRREDSVPMLCPLVGGLGAEDWRQLSRAYWI